MTKDNNSEKDEASRLWEKLESKHVVRKSVTQLTLYFLYIVAILIVFIGLWIVVFR